MNLTALQRRDPYIDRVIETASQVALYDYDTTSDAWTNTDVEGSLFLYERVVAPYHGFTISNRKQPNNHWEALNEHVEFQNPEDDHFLLYKNRDKIFGIWFFDVAERRKIGDLARQLVARTTSATENLNQNETATGKHGIMTDIFSSSSSAPSSGSGDIFSLLYKAQHEYNQNNANNNTIPCVESSPLTKQNQHSSTQSRDPLGQPPPQPSQPLPPPPPQPLPQPLQQLPNQLHRPSFPMVPTVPQQSIPPANALADQIEPRSERPQSISLSSLFANAKSQQQREMKLPAVPVSVPVSVPAAIGGAALTAPPPSYPSVTLAAPPSVQTAPITAPITTPSSDSPSLSGKPAFVPLDDGVEANALQLFVQKMKIHDDRRSEENVTDNKPLPLRMDGGSGVASRRRKEPASKHKIHRNSVPSHSPPSIEKLPQIPPHFTNSNSSGMLPSSDSTSPTSPVPEKPISAGSGLSLLPPDAFERPPAKVNDGFDKRSQSWGASASSSSTTANKKSAAAGSVASKIAASLVRNSFALTSDEDAASEQNSSDDVDDDDSCGDVDDDSDDVARSSGKSGGEEVAGLTKEQLRATLVHLLQSDNAFLETIHAGYVACLKAPVSKRHGVGKK